MVQLVLSRWSCVCEVDKREMTVVLPRLSTPECDAGQMEVELVLSRQSYLCEVGQMELKLVLTVLLCVCGAGQIKEELVLSRWSSRV